MIKQILFLTLFSLSFISCESNKTEKQVDQTISKPNIVMFLADDQGWGDLGINGNMSLATPNIDQLAEKGISFDRFFVCAVCSPTRAEMLTGRYHVRSGVSATSSGKERFDLDETTIAEVFKAGGYQTAAYGKWHSGMQAPYHPNSRGFDDFYGFCSGHWGNYFDPMLEHNGEIVKGEGFIIDDLTNHGIAFIEQNKDDPFFLYLPYNTPHSPMQVPDKYWDKFKDLDLPQKGTIPDKEQIVHTRAALAMVENIDYNVGRIISKLEELHLSENTIVIYFSDNGPNGHRWNGGMSGTKGSTDEGGVRSPLFIKWKGSLKEGRTISEISSAIDLLPTLADLAGIENTAQKPMDGLSLKPLLLDEKPEWEDRMITNYWRDKTSIRSQNYRLNAKDQLFDMVNDPNQTRDISKERIAILSDLLAEKERWKKEVLSELPNEDLRPFILGHPSLAVTQVPARDAVPHGNIKRSNKYPNDSYFYDWTTTQDKITWQAEIADDGEFEVEVYYTCQEDAVGSNFEISFNSASLGATIEKAYNSPKLGSENDRFERVESYVKDFKSMKMGTIRLKKGKGELKLQATKINGKELMQFRLLTLRRL